jgi:hypothetical protein
LVSHGHGRDVGHLLGPGDALVVRAGHGTDHLGRRGRQAPIYASAGSARHVVWSGARALAPLAMPLPLIIVELPAVANDGKETAALIEACTSALSAGRCALARDEPNASANAVAVVSFRNDARLNAAIEVGRQRGARDSWLTQEFEFQRDDAPSERYRTLGLAIATLFHDITEGRNAAAEHAETTSRAVNAPQMAVARSALPGAEHRGPLWLMAGVSTAASSDFSTPRWGAQGSLFLAPWTARFALVASGSYAVASEPDFTMAFVALGLGLAAEFPIEPLALRFQLEGVAEHLTAKARTEESGPGRSSGGWLGGARAGVNVVWRPHGRLGAVAGVALEQQSGRTEVSLRGVPLLTLGSTSWLGVIALEVRPFARP